MPPNRHTRNGTCTDCKLGTDKLDWLEHRESAQRLSGLYAPVYLPDYRPQDFVGRAAQLVRRTLCDEPSVFLLHGEPGAGKSRVPMNSYMETVHLPQSESRSAPRDARNATSSSGVSWAPFILSMVRWLPASKKNSGACGIR
jgi:hypothetical protein